MSATMRGEALPALTSDRRFRRRQSGLPRRKNRSEPWSLALVRRLAPIAIVVLLAFVVAQQVYYSPRFQIQRVTVHGNQRLSVGEVRSLLGGLDGQRLFDVDIDAWRSTLLESPWVADARLHRVLPSTIDVTVVERLPLATLRSGDQLFLLDESGGIIDEYGPQYADVDLPIVDGLADDPLSPLRRAREALLRRVLSSLSARRDLLARISQIDLRDAHDAVVLLEDDPARLHLGEVDFVERLRSYLELKGALLERVPTMDYVDLRFGPRVFVRPAVVAKPTTPDRAER